MTRKNLLLSLLVILLPILVFADEVQSTKSPMTIWSLLLTTKYIVGLILVIIQLVILWSKKLSPTVRVVSLLVSFVAFAIYFPLHPSPVCAVTKPFIYGFRVPFLASIIFVGVLSIVSSKGFCGTICPAGSLQELLYRIPIFSKLKKRRISFKIMNSIRIGVQVLFASVLLLAGITIFSYFNLFELFHWSFDMPALYLTIFIVSLVIILSASLIIYRPFCYFVCPVGLLTWLLEPISVFKIRYDKEKCNECGVCETESPCPAVPDMRSGKKLAGDCHLCGICIESCSESAFYYGMKK